MSFHLAANSDSLEYDEVPCEFCDELFPFDFIIEHQSACRPELLHYNLEDVDPVEEKQDVIEYEEINKESELNSSSTFGNDIKAIQQPLKELKITDDKSSFLDKEEKEDLSGATSSTKDSFFQENETKLMSYGVKPQKNPEEESQRFKVPSLPMFNDTTEKIIHCNSLSDDEDFGESLESFWNRADIKFSKMLSASKCNETSVSKWRGMEK